ncbi:hypothetical protein [Hufsiella ginkgonis]|uniref:GLPGLI family protein n=1 Tax=Hufsiella ginkgonis TaxID=2695274 RepID=A0A7K1XY62_9SPHI|nr:hypothetical protein [Hufsiella ginkgonis]MXV15883.1 hypothetical protein [Hufsiella ginkgonis]
MLKKFYTICLLVTAAVINIQAQDKTSGVIYYEQVIELKMANGQPGGGVVAFGGGGSVTLPKSITNHYEIEFSPAGAKYQKTIEDVAPATGGLVMRMGGSEREMFFRDEKVIESFELDGEPLMMENKLGYGSAKAENTDETKMIAGYTCKKAVITGLNDAKTTIWYTPELAFKASPLSAFWTEGVVLGIENDRMKMFATSIEYRKVKDSEFTLPKKARLLTQEEYAKKMEEFRAKMGNGISVGPNGERRVIRMN